MWVGGRAAISKAQWTICHSTHACAAGLSTAGQRRLGGLCGPESHSRGGRGAPGAIAEPGGLINQDSEACHCAKAARAGWESRAATAEWVAKLPSERSTAAPASLTEQSSRTTTAGQRCQASLQSKAPGKVGHTKLPHSGAGEATCARWPQLMTGGRPHGPQPMRRQQPSACRHMQQQRYRDC